MTKFMLQFTIKNEVLIASGTLLVVVMAVGVWCAFGHRDQHESPVRWYTDIDQARKAAADSNKLVLMDFFATWCGPCQRMRATTLADPSLEKALNSYVCVSIDIDVHPELANQLGVTSIPAFFVLNPETGRVVKENREGAVSVAEFRAWLTSHLPSGI